MADRVFTKFASAATDTLLLDDPPSGLQWVIWQLSVQITPFRAGSVVEVKRNGVLLTSSPNGGRASASGAPAIVYRSGDDFTVTWTGLTVGDQLICSLMYEEVPWGMQGTGFGLV